MDARTLMELIGGTDVGPKHCPGKARPIFKRPTTATRHAAITPPLAVFQGLSRLAVLPHHPLAMGIRGRHALALFLQNRISETFTVDIHPAARIGRGILLDHGHGFVVGETAVIEDNVSILHNVTLGGTGKAEGDRHRKSRYGVLIGAGAKILGNIEVGRGARVGAGGVVLEPVPAHTTVAGVPRQNSWHGRFQKSVVEYGSPPELRRLNINLPSDRTGAMDGVIASLFLHPLTVFYQSPAAAGTSKQEHHFHRQTASYAPNLALIRQATKISIHYFHYSITKQ